MRIELALKYIKKYGKCEKCGNVMIGNGQGTMHIDEDKFARSCKCGWSINLKIKDGEADE